MRRIALALLLITSPAFALSNRVFVKSTGLDTGTCPITSPCRSFSYAMTQVSPGGEIIALDTAGYGTFTINQSVSVIAAPGATAFIAVTGFAGITITAGDAVILRGLALTANGGANGIDFQGGTALSIENCVINGFSSAGVNMMRSADTTNPRIRIEHTTIRYNVVGVRTENDGQAPPQGGPPPATAGLVISNSTISENTAEGLEAEDNTRAAVGDTVFPAMRSAFSPRRLRIVRIPTSTWSTAQSRSTPSPAFRPASAHSMASCASHAT